MGPYVAHPPGYPLWVWLQHFWIKIINYGTPFWRASTLNAVFAVLALSFLSRGARNQNLIWPALLLALSPAFAEAAVLPDVFSLHALFVAVIVWLYLGFDSISKARRIWLPFLFAFGSVHHHTLILLAPLALFAIWESFRDSVGARRSVVTSMCAGFLLSGLLYYSLLEMHPSSPFSWGDLKEPKDLLAHVLRSEYGTFKFSGGAYGFFPQRIFEFFKVSFLPWSGVCAGALYLGHRRGSLYDPAVHVLAASLVLNILFLGVCGCTGDAFCTEVLIRFHVMPLVILAFLIFRILEPVSSRGPEAMVLAAVAVFSLIYSGTLLKSWPKLRDDSAIEESLGMVLNEAGKAQASVILSAADHESGGLQYLQLHNGTGKKVAVASVGLTVFPWVYPKLKAQQPKLTIPGIEETLKTRKLHVPTQVVNANSGQVQVFSTFPMTDPRDTRITYLEVGQRLDPGQGMAFPPLPPARPRTIYPRPPRGPQKYTRGLAYAMRADRGLAEAKAAMAVQQVPVAVEAWKRVLKLVPYATPAQDGLCLMEKGSYCTDPRLLELSKRGKIFF